MNKKLWILFTTSVFLVFFGGFWIGYMAGEGRNLEREEARITHNAAQVRYLLQQAYFSDRAERPIGRAEVVPPASILETVERHKDSPEMVRSILYAEVNRERDRFLADLAGTRQDELDGQTYLEYTARLAVLSVWKPGQVTPKPEASEK